jgi:hypothetical protein
MLLLLEDSLWGTYRKGRPSRSAYANDGPEAKSSRLNTYKSGRDSRRSRNAP